MPQITADRSHMLTSATKLFGASGSGPRVHPESENWTEVDRTLWREFAAMGWLSLLVAAYGSPNECELDLEVAAPEWQTSVQPA